MNGALADSARAGLWLLAELTLPVVLPVLATAFIVGLLQAATSINEATLSFVPKLAVLLASLFLFGAFLARALADFTQGLFERIPGLLR